MLRVKIILWCTCISPKTPERLFCVHTACPINHSSDNRKNRNIYPNFTSTKTAPSGSRSCYSFYLLVNSEFQLEGGSCTTEQGQLLCYPVVWGGNFQRQAAQTPNKCLLKRVLLQWRSPWVLNNSPNPEPSTWYVWAYAVYKGCINSFSLSGSPTSQT